MALTDIQPAHEDDDAVVDEPPRNTTKAQLPASCVLKRSSYNRTKLFVPEAQQYNELRCSSSITQYVDRDSRFHSLTPLNNRTAEDFSHTKVHCWHDTFPFDGPVVPLPKSYDGTQRCFVVFGCFCSLSCAKAFLCEHSTFETGMQVVLLERMAAEVYGVSNITAAPPRLAINIFGGPYSIERFRSIASGATVKTGPEDRGGGGCEVSLIGPPFVSSYMVCEERSADTSRVSVLGVNGISSVRGLRRPAQPVDMQARQIPEHSPYVDFVKSRGGTMSSNDHPAVTSATSTNSADNASVQRRSSQTSGALTRFMKKKA